MKVSKGYEAQVATIVSSLGQLAYFVAAVAEHIAVEDTDTDSDLSDQEIAVAGEECSNDVVYDYMGLDGGLV